MLDTEQKRIRKKYKIICKYCWLQWEANSKKWLFCNHSCYARYRIQLKEKFTCRWCLKEFNCLSNSRKQKFCSRECSKVKLNSDCVTCWNNFIWRSNTRREKYCSNECFRIKAHEWKKKDRRSTTLAKYWITEDDFNRMYNEQWGVCAICWTDNIRKWRGGKKNLCVDHNHDTLKVRWLLCDRCNIVIWMVKEDTSLLFKSAEYLDHYNNL